MAACGKNGIAATGSRLYRLTTDDVYELLKDDRTVSCAFTSMPETSVPETSVPENLDPAERTFRVFSDNQGLPNSFAHAMDLSGTEVLGYITALINAGNGKLSKVHIHRTPTASEMTGKTEMEVQARTWLCTVVSQASKPPRQKQLPSIYYTHGPVEYVAPRR